MFLGIFVILAILFQSNVDAHPANNAIGKTVKVEDIFLNNSESTGDLAAEDEIDPCFQNPCRNGGNCKTENGNLVCSCIGIYTGKYCEKGNCTRDGCANGGTCNADGNCSCPPFTGGPRCEEIDCSAVQPGCKDTDGRCIYREMEKKIYCYCGIVNFFNETSKRCEAGSAAYSCGNGGTWIASHFCLCLPGTFGVNCERVDCSRVNPQCEESGGRCGYSVADVRPVCQCPETKIMDKESGKCEEKCPSDRCRNGGMCENTGRCICPPGIYGVKCEKVDCKNIYSNCDESGGRCVYSEEEENVVCDCPNNRMWNKKLQECEVQPPEEKPPQRVPLLIIQFFAGLFVVLGFIVCCMCWSNLMLKRMGDHK